MSITDEQAMAVAAAYETARLHWRVYNLRGPRKLFRVLNTGPLEPVEVADSDSAIYQYMDFASEREADDYISFKAMFSALNLVLGSVP